MFERFTDQARRAIVLAQEAAREWNHDYIGTEHILLGIVGAEGSLGARTLAEFGATKEVVEREMRTILEPGAVAPGTQITFTPRAKKTLEDSLRMSVRTSGGNHIGTEHLALALVEEIEGIAGQLLARLGVGAISFTERIVGLAGGEAMAAGGESMSMAVPDEPARLAVAPRCPGCKADLLQHLGAHRTEVPSAEGAPIKVCLVYCTSCGHTFRTEVEPGA